MSRKFEEYVKVILDLAGIPESAQKLMSRIKIPLSFAVVFVVIVILILKFGSETSETTQQAGGNSTQIGGPCFFCIFKDVSQSTNATPYNAQQPSVTPSKSIIDGSLNNYEKGGLQLSPCIGILGDYNLDDGNQQSTAWDFLEKRLAEMEPDKRNSVDIRLIEEARDEWNRGHSHEAIVKFNVALSCPNIAFDKYTHLTWQKSPNCDSLKWTDAKDYCVALTMAGHNDWRLPTEQELQNMLKRKSFSPLNDVFGADCPFPDSYWSSSLEGIKYALLVEQKSALDHKRPISDKDYGYVWCLHN